MFVMNALDLILVYKFPQFSKKIYSTICATNSVSIRNGLMHTSTAHESQI